MFLLVCHAFLSITFAFSSYSRSVEARNCRSDRRETGTQIGQIRKTKNRIGYKIRKPVSIFCENRELNVKKRKIRKPQWTPKPKFFWRKNRKTNLKNSQNRKSQCPPRDSKWPEAIPVALFKQDERAWTQNWRETTSIFITRFYFPCACSFPDLTRFNTLLTFPRYIQLHFHFEKKFADFTSQ